MDNTVSENLNSVNRGNPLLNLFQESLPERPYCTDELGQLFIRVKDQAIKRRYIQQNSPFDLRWLVYDVDSPTAIYNWYDQHAPAPNITAINPDNGHGHLFYGLEIPVYKQPEAHAAPLRYAAAVDVALTKKLEADPGYAGLICKNPLHKKWNVQIWESVPYDLNLLADYLDLTPYEDKRKLLPPIGLGRNCTVFDSTRHWAYRQIRRPGVFLSFDFFLYEVTQYAVMRNNQFLAPLPYSEIKATGKSIAKWTWKNMSPEGFKQWGDNRRKKSIFVRRNKSDEKAEELRAYKKAHPEATKKEISIALGYPLGTVKRLLIV